MENKKQCVYCGKDFTFSKYYTKKKFCSYACSMKYSWKKGYLKPRKKGTKPWNKGKGKIRGITIICKTCKKDFVNKESYLKIYCNNKCRSLDPDLNNQIAKKLTGRKQTKELIEKRIAPLRGRPSKLRGRSHSQKSKEKMRLIAKKIHGGKNNNNWKGGITKLNEKIRKSYYYKEWRESVFKRDDWTCQECKKKGVFINAHHKEEYEFIIKKNKITTFKQAIVCGELWNIRNGITLCKECHKLKHLNINLFKNKI